MIVNIAVRRLPLLAALSLAPMVARSQEAGGAEPEPEVVAEALYLHDCLPAGSRDLNLSLGLEWEEPDAETGDRSLETSPRVQLALPVGDRIGFTVEVGFGASGELLDTPGASFKLLLRRPGAGRTGLSTSLDVFGSTHSLARAETGIGIGAIRAFGGVWTRVAVAVATELSAWSPHVHGGLSAAVALSDRWRALGELVAEVGGGEIGLWAGPTLKVALGETTALTVGSLLPVAPARLEPRITLLITQAM